MSAVEVSYSRVQSYERCPWLYHLVYDEGWRTGPSGPAAFGQSLHRTLAAFLAPNEPRSLDHLLEIFDQTWVNEGFASPQETLEWYERGRTMLTHFFDLDRARRSEVAATEKDFDVTLDSDVHLRGTVDRLDRWPDGTFEIIEYKTGADTWSPERIASDRQMTFYALGLGATLGKAPLKLSYFFLSSGRAVETHRTPDQLEEARALILDTAAKLRRRDYEPNFSSCPRCEFKKRCSKYRPA